MRYFVKKTTPSKKGEYLQIYISRYIPGKGNRNSSHAKLGYVSELKAKGIEDPYAWAKGQADELNRIQAEREGKAKGAKVGESPAKRNIGHFMAKSVIDALDVDGTMALMSSNGKLRYGLKDLVRQLVYAQIVSPGSKRRAYFEAIPSLYGAKPLSYEQILDGVEYIGQNYEKFVELFGEACGRVWPSDRSVAYFDCTNHYFEADLPREDLQKGPSKENRREPIIGQALLLDASGLPIGMSLYPGNRSENPKIRKSIEAMKSRYGVEGRVVQVADKGPNCARNVYAAVKEADDGYIFSKSVKGRSVPEAEREWVLLDNEQNVWHEAKDGYTWKECVDEFGYSFAEGGETKAFRVKEKRIVTYSPALARKQRAEIMREADKARSLSLRGALREEYGDSVKYVKAKGKAELEFDQGKVDEDLAYAGYNMLVTSEASMPAEEIVAVYRNLWRIEQSFRIMKTGLEARPVYLRKAESIYGHFLICYLALVVLRILEDRVFKGELAPDEITDLMRRLEVADAGEGRYVSCISARKSLTAAKAAFGLEKLDSLYLTERNLRDIMGAEIPLD